MKIRYAYQAVFCLVSLSLGFGVAAADHNGTYVGVQYAMVEDEDLDLEPTAGVIRVGTSADEGYGYEFRIGTGLSDDGLTETLPFPFGVTSADLEIDYIFGVYLLAEAPVGAGSIYGILGFTQAEFTLEVDSQFLGPGSASEDESDISFGFGANFGVSDKVKINIEFMQYLDKDDADASAISLGLLF